MSRLITNAIRSTSASADAITLDGSGNATFPANVTCSGTATGFGVEGITQADIWRLTTNYALATSGTLISSNLERADDATATYIGGGMTESSGIFTFPATGKYIVLAFGSFYQSSGSGTPYAVIDTLVSSNSGSAYDAVARLHDEVTASGRQSGAASISPIIDVTDASTFRVKFDAFSGHSGCNMTGDSAENRTCFAFIRLGDT